MSDATLIDIATQAMLVALKLSAPILLTSLCIGFTISLFQSMTQIQEFTLAFVPKVVGVGIALLMPPWSITAHVLWIERIVITDKRVMLAEGFIVHKVGMMPLSKVTDLTFERSIGGRMLGYGTLIVESAGQIQALNRIDYMPRPEEVYEALSELVFGEKGKTRATGMLARPRWRR